MDILYCEQCGRRVTDGEVAEGRAVQTAGNGWLCGACARPVPKPATQRTTTGAARIPASTRRSSTAALPKAADSQPIPRTKPALNPVVIGLIVGGITLMVAAAILLSSGQGGGGNRPPVEAGATPAVSKDTPRRPEAAASGASGAASAPSNKPLSSVSTTSEPDPGPAAPASLAERAKQAEKEMQDFRNQRAAKLLEEHRAWFKQNPSDPWTYQARLREIAASYGSAPAAVEARRLLDELKSLPPPPDRLETSAPESKEYQLVYDLDLARIGPSIAYDVDNRSKIKPPFDRIAYFLELQRGGGETQYLYVSMDAFSDDLSKIGIPTLASGARFQQNVTNMNVWSNVKGIVTGTGLAGGNIEFWPNNYGGGNSAKVPNASSQTFDFGDQPGDPVDGYGSMQVHNHDAKQTLFALNHWREGGSADLGIGNQPGGNPDWTFSGSAGSYRVKRLRVLVHCK